MQRYAQRVADRDGALCRHPADTSPTRAHRGVIHPRNLGQLGDPSGGSNQLVNRHAAYVATGNQQMQGVLLPQAAAGVLSFWHFV